MAFEVSLRENALLKRFGHSHHIDGLARLIGRNADDQFHPSGTFGDRADDVLRTADVRLDRLEGKILAGRHLLQGRCIEDDVRFADRDRDARVIADIADPEGQQVFGVLIDDLVRGGATILVLQPHVMLLGLVARKHRDASGPPELARQQTPHERAAHRASPPSDEYSPVR